MNTPKHNKIDKLCLCDTMLRLTFKNIEEKIIDRNTLDAAKAEYYEHQAMLRCGQYPAITVFKNDKVVMCYVYVDIDENLCLPF